MEEWKIMGQVGSVIKNENTSIVHIAKNKFKKDHITGQSVKLYTVWFTCICFFDLDISTGDKVVAGGDFIPSKNPNFPYIMNITNIGVVKKKQNTEKEEDLVSDEKEDQTYYKFDFDEKNYQEYMKNIQ